MNEFEKQIAGICDKGLYSLKIETLQVNLGLRCNQQCSHCHLEASPQRKEMMEWPTMQMVLKAVETVDCKLIDLTGGAPELNPNFRRFVKALCQEGRRVQVRTNLTVLLEPDMEGLPEFFRDHRVQLVASLPCYLQENVCAQRGRGVYERSIEAIKRLNGLGYGSESGLPLNLVYNPGGPFLPPPQLDLEKDYRRELGQRFGVAFTRLLTSRLRLAWLAGHVANHRQHGRASDGCVGPIVVWRRVTVRPLIAVGVLILCAGHGCKCHDRGGRSDKHSGSDPYLDRLH